MHKNKEAGFTLVELMVSIVVLAILTAIAIPSFMTLLPGMRLNGAARQVMGDLMAARMKAVKLNQRTKIYFDNSSQYRICDDADNNATVANGEGDVEMRDIHPEYSDVNFGSVGEPVFSPRGTATNRTITLLSTSGAGSKSITISIAGRVKIN